MSFPLQPSILRTLRPQSPENPGDRPLRLRAPRVLVVDDNPDLMVLMRELLETRGYDVIAVPDAEQAEAEIRRQPPDLILSDVVMPGKSGYELCRELKEGPGHAPDPLRTDYRFERS